MKKQDVLKTIQLIVSVLFAMTCIFLVFLNKNMYHQIAEDSNTKALALLLWAWLLLSFVFMLLDFLFSASVKKDYHELDYAVHSDPISGLANRLSADALIESYLDKPVPDNFGCAMIDLSNIREINERLGHLAGNALIRDFSDVLTSAGNGICYVARNGGNKFLAIFDKTAASLTEKEINRFLERVKKLVEAYNEKNPQHIICYRVGVAFNENDPKAVRSVPDMIALANRRIY